MLYEAKLNETDGRDHIEAITDNLWEDGYNVWDDYDSQGNYVEAEYKIDNTTDGEAIEFALKKIDGELYRVFVGEKYTYVVILYETTRLFLICKMTVEFYNKYVRGEIFGSRLS